MADQSIAISAKNLSKCYRIFDQPRHRLLQGILGKRVKLYREFWALRDVSFELARGRTLGVVGRNGSGKSTLLQLLCGTLSATSGEVGNHGRVGALLELGSGFNPEFTGLENVYLNARILGLNSQEIDNKLDAILAFADIGDFIHQPTKNYSSGMAVRLAFAVQAHIDPEILIVDEALAVGDELFQKKCYTHLSKLKESGCAILLVTHSCGQIIQHCDEAMLLHQGRLRLMGQPSVITTTYQQLAGSPEHTWDEVISRKQTILATTTLKPTPTSPTLSAAHTTDKTIATPKSREIYASRGAEIVTVQLETPEGQPQNQFSFGNHFQIRFRYRSQQSFNELSCGCNISRVSGQRITGQCFPTFGGDVLMTKPGDTWEVVFSFGSGLYPGVYFVGGGLWESSEPGKFIHRVVDYCAFRILESPVSQPIGLCDLSAGPAALIRQPEELPLAGT